MVKNPCEKGKYCIQNQILANPKKIEGIDKIRNCQILPQHNVSKQAKKGNYYLYWILVKKKFDIGNVKKNSMKLIHFSVHYFFGGQNFLKIFEPVLPPV